MRTGRRKDQVEIADSIRAFLADELPPVKVARLRDHTPLLTGLLDSLEIVRLLSFVEDDLGIELGFEEVTEENFATVASLERFLRGRVAGGARTVSPSHRRPSSGGEARGDAGTAGSG